MIQQTKHWQQHSPAPEALLSAAAIHPVLAQVLFNRGLASPAEMERFLTVHDSVVEDPLRLLDMAKAVDRLVRAIHRRQIICVYGDFDADGVTATALLVTALLEAGARVGPYIPDRVDEGYGLNVAAIQRIAKAGAGVLVTVDCGIRSVAEVQAAVGLGLDVIITDHHSVGPLLPPAFAVVNPKRPDDKRGFDGLAGVGVAYRLAQGVLRALAKDKRSQLTEDRAGEIEADLLEFVALGTVADMLPLVGENRSLVQRGLVRLNRTTRPGLLALCEASSTPLGTIDTTAIGFRLAPRINAAGRLGDAVLAYKLLRTKEPAEAIELAAKLEALNQERRNLTLEITRQAEEQIAPQIEMDSPLFIASGPDFRSGIVGLVAGRLADRHYRPALIIEEGDDECRGSARSIREFHVTDALDQVSHLLVRHGGHQMAAGFTLRREDLDEFKQAMTAIAHQKLGQYNGDLRPTLSIDAELPLGEVNWGLQKQLARLEPTGQGNPSPLFLFPACRVRKISTVGKGQHLKLLLSTGRGGEVVDAIAFGFGPWAAHLEPGCQVDLASQIGINEWNGDKHLQLLVEDMRLTQK